MPSEDLSHTIPKHLDDPAKFLFWELDIAGIALIGVLLGIACGAPIIGLGLGITMALLYGKAKAGQHPGMAMHLLFWFTGYPEPKELPKSHLREFNG